MKYTTWINRHKLSKTKLKNSSRKCVNACCFVIELRACLLETNVLRKIAGKSHWCKTATVSAILQTKLFFRFRLFALFSIFF